MLWRFILFSCYHRRNRGFLILDDFDCTPIRLRIESFFDPLIVLSILVLRRPRKGLCPLRTRKTRECLISSDLSNTYPTPHRPAHPCALFPCCHRALSGRRGRAAIRPTMAPNNRRVRWLSARAFCPQKPSSADGRARFARGELFLKSEILEHKRPGLALFPVAS